MTKENEGVKERERKRERKRKRERERERRAINPFCLRRIITPGCFLLLPIFPSVFEATAENRKRKRGKEKE